MLQHNHPPYRPRPTWLGGLLAITGCSDTAATPAPSVTGHAELFDRISAALSVNSAMSIRGTYGAGCTQRSGTWDIALNGYQLTADEVALTVVTSDSGCTLAVTDIKGGTPSQTQSYQPLAPFALAADYAAIGVPFVMKDAAGTQFYANFRITPDLEFTTDFVVQMVYSDDINETDLTSTTSCVESTATATAGATPAPVCALSLAGLKFAVDAKNIVKNGTGNATLTQGAVPAEGYLIDLGTLGAAPGYAAIDGLYASKLSEVVTLQGVSQTIKAAEFKLATVDLTLPQKRNLIVAHTANGVRSYRLFQITIKHPAGQAGDTTPPTVISTQPLDKATGVAIAAPVTAKFSEALDPLTVTSSSFTLKQGGLSVLGTTTYANLVATMTPTASLLANTVYTATLGTSLTDVAGNALANSLTWTFTTATPGSGPVAPNLKNVANYAILAGTTVAIGAAGAVTGNVGLTPGSSSAMTGLGLVLDTSGTFSTSPVVVGKVYTANNAAPTPATLSADALAMQAAYADGSGRAQPDGIGLGAGQLGGLKLIPGLYNWSGAALITTDVTLNGGANDVWILQVGGALTVAATAKVKLTGGAQANNVYWVVVGAVAVGANAQFEGNILSQAAVSAGAGATVNGRMLTPASATLGAGSTLKVPSL